MRIKELRLLANLTQSELGKQIGCNQTAIGKYERGDLEPNLQTLTKLCTIFNCSLDYLVGIEDDFGNVILEEREKLSNKERQLLSLYRTLSETEQNKLITDAEFYSKNIKN